MTAPLAEVTKQRIRWVPAKGRARDWGSMWRVSVYEDRAVGMRGRDVKHITGTHSVRKGKRGDLHVFTTEGGHWEVERCGC